MPPPGSFRSRKSRTERPSSRIAGASAQAPANWRREGQARLRTHRGETPWSSSRRRRRRRWSGARSTHRTEAGRSTSRGDSTSRGSLLVDLLGLGLLPLFLRDLLHLLDVNEGALLVADDDVGTVVAVHVGG